MRSAGISAKHPGSRAAAARGRGRDHFAGRCFGDIPVTVHAGGGEEPLPVRLFRRPGAGVPLHASMIQRYVSKISGPLLDRIDIHIEVPAVKYKELRAPSSAEDAASVRQRVIAARNRQFEKFQSEKKTYVNAQMMPKMIRKHCAISPKGEKLLENAITRRGLSARAHDRILKVARTIADPDGGEIGR